MKQMYMLNNSKDVIRTLVGLKSRMTTCLPCVTSDSILSRICLVSLIWLVVGGFSTKAWADRTHTGRTAVVAGQGTATVKIHYRKTLFGGWDAQTGATNSTTGSSLVTATYSRSNAYDGSIAFYATNSVTGYTFSGWYSDASCNSFLSNENPYVPEKNTSSSGVTKTAYAKFTPTDVSFNANGGSVDPTTKTVTDNATYGTLPTPTRSNYTFLNWYTGASDGTVVTSSTTVTNKVNHTLYAHWTPNYIITLTAGAGTTSAGTTSITVALNLNNNLTSAITTPTKSGNVFDGYYTGANGTGTQIIDAFGNVIAQAGGDDTYTDASKNWKYANNIELHANWIAKYDFEITGSNYTINNEAWTQTTAFNFVHADEEHMITTIEKTDVISYNRGSNTITALKIGTSKITFTQNTSTTVNNGEIEFTITVDSVANNLAVSNTSFTRFVEQDIANIRSGENSNGTISTTSTNPNLAHYNIATNTIEIPNSNAQKLPFEDVTITISQAATAKYKYKKHTITLTVQKYTNTLTCSWGSWSKNVGFDSETGVTFGSDNDTETPIVVTPNPSSAIATYDGTNHKIVANYRAGDVSWTVSQAEDYKYQAATPQTLSVNVGTAYTNCYLVDDAPQREWSSQGNSGTYAFTLDQPGDTLFFDAERIDICFVFCEGNNTDWHIQYSTKMSPGDDDWTKLKDDQGNDVAIECEYKDTYYNGFKYAIPADARAIRFRTANIGSFGKKHIRNVKVGRKKWLTLENEGGSEISELDMPINTKGGNVTHKTFYIDYSTCASKIKLVSSNDRIKFAANNSTTYEFDVENGTRKAIELTYTSLAEEAEVIHPTITVYTPYEHETLTVNAETKGNLETHLVYLGHASYPVDTTNIPVADLFEVRDENNDVVAGATITLGTSDPAKVAIDGTPNSIDLICSGTVTITASYGGDGVTYAEADDLPQDITINKINDEVSFDSGYGSMVVGEAIDLSEWVTSCTSGTAISVTSVFTDYIVIEDGKVKAVAKGEGQLRAESEGNCAYNSGSTILNITVRNLEDPCGSSILYKSNLIKVGAYAHGSGDPETYTIPDGPQDKLTFKVWRVPKATQEATLQILDKNENVLTNGTIEYAASSLPSSEPDAPNKEINMADYPGAKKLRFYGWGTLNKYFKEVRVSQKAYLTPSTKNVSMSTVKACVESSGEFTVAYSDLSRIHLDHKNAGFRYEVWEGSDSIGNFDNDCGEYGTYTIKCFCTPEAKGEFKDSVFLSAAGQRDTIVVSGTADKADRSIAWNIPNGNNITATQTIQLTAKAYTACDTLDGGIYYTYESTTPDAATIDGDYITFHKQATVTVTAHTSPSDYYYDAVIEPYKTWAVGKVGTQMRRLPTITSTITYGDTKSVVTYDNDSWCGEDVLSHDSVPGTIAYVGPDNFTAAGPTNLSFNFTPSDLSVYDAQPFTVQVTVQKATTTASANAILLTYGETPDSKALSTASAALDGTWSWNDDRSDDVLNASAEAYVLNVTFTPDNTNYEPYQTTVNVTVNKANPVATVENVSFVYGTKAEDVALVGTGAGTWSWTDSRKGQVLAVGEYTMDVHFAPTDGTNYNEKDATVTLTVNKIEALQVPVALSFCAGGSETYRGTTYTEAGTYPVNAVGATRDTVYNVTVTVLQPTTGTDSKTITAGDNESWNGIDLSGYAAGSHSVEVVLTNAAGCDSTVTLTLTVNALIINQFTNASGDGDWDNNANWSSGSKPAEADPDVIVSGDLVIDSEVTVGSLTIETGNRVVLTVNGDLTINGTSEVRAEYGSLYVENGGEVEVNGNLKVGDLTVEASIGTSNGSAASGQVDKAENIVYANAYIEINMDPSGTLDDTKFYGFTVPFDVDVHNGISRKENGVYRQCAYGTHYMIAEYDANKRLNSGKGWKYISGNTLQAGTFYYLTVDGNYNTYRFKAKDATYTQAAPSTLVMNGATSNPNANWNAVGNSTLQHAKASFEGGNYVQVYENGLDAYRTVSVTEATFVVGCPFFIQAKEASTLVLDVPTSSTELYYAPRRSKAAQEGVSRVNLISVEGGYSDQIYVCGSDKEENAYITGRDLAKAGESKVVPQIWVNTYNQKLSVHEAAWQGENAVCPLGIYVPKNGEYTLTATQAEDGTQVYLTIDGMPVWNISETEYVLSLNKGTMSNFGLMLVKAPKIATGVENVEANEGENAQKMILNDQMYILRNGKMYDAAGRKVK